MRSLIVFVLAGAGAQLIDGALGMGFGVTSASILGGLGMYPLAVSASVHMAELFASLGSGVSHAAFGNVDRKILVPLVLSGVTGAVGGAAFLAVMSAHRATATLLPRMTGLILFLMGLVIVLRFVFSNGRRAFRDTAHPVKLVLLGTAAGFSDAVGGGGWGPIMTTGLVVTGFEPRRAIGSVDLTEFFVTAAMTVTLFLLAGPGQFRWDAVALLAGGAVVVSAPAAWLCGRLPYRALGITVGALLMLLNAVRLVR